MLTGQNGILNRGGEAKEKTEDAQTDELVKMAAMSALAQGLGKIESTEMLDKELENHLGTGVYELAGEPKKGWTVKVEDKAYIVDGNGEVILTNWLEQEDGSIKSVDGKVTLQIGDYVNYDPTNGGALTSDTKCKYTAPQGTYVASNAGQDGGMEFGTGVEGAEGARAITVEDINKVTGYDPEKEGNVEGAEYAKGQVYEYGNKVTYKNNESRITYQGTKQPAEETTSEYSMFRYYDETNKTWKSLARDEKKEYTSSSYYYYPKTLTTNASGTQVGKITHNEYSTLFSFSGGSSYYWLSSRCVYTNSGIAGFGLHYVISGNNVYNYSLYFSGGSAASYTYGVRPVVTLKSDIQLEPSETANQWNIVK